MTFRIYSSTVSSAEMVSLQGMRMIAFEQLWSVIVRIKSNPSDVGSLVMKSRAIVEKGRASSFGVIVMNTGL